MEKYIVSSEVLQYTNMTKEYFLKFYLVTFKLIRNLYLKIFHLVEYHFHERKHKLLFIFNKDIYALFFRCIP